jgi:hypothetical protein
MHPKTPISPGTDVPAGAAPNHGLDPQEEKFRTRLGQDQEIRRFYAFTPELPPPGADPTSWAESVSWTELGTLSLAPGDASSGEGSGDMPPVQLSPDTRLKHMATRRFFNIRTALDRKLETTSFFECDLPRETIDAARQLAKDALAAILPMQAYLFIPPDELARAQREAEKIAREFAADCLKIAQNDAEHAKKSLKSGDLTSGLRKRLRSLSERHDARYHVFPYSQRYAPETGIATVAVIESRHQSITGDHGRARMSTV